MNKLIVYLLVLGSGAASAQVSDSAVAPSLRLDSLPGHAWLANGLSANPAQVLLGLHADAGEWHFDLALPDPSHSPRMWLGSRADRTVGDVGLGVSRSFGLPSSTGSFWEMSNFSLVANAGYAGGAEDSLRPLWSGGLGAAWRMTPASSLGVNYRIESGTQLDGAATRSLGLSYGYQFSSGLRLNTSLGRGLSDGAPKWGGGLSLSFSQ